MRNARIERSRIASQFKTFHDGSPLALCVVPGYIEAMIAQVAIALAAVVNGPYFNR